MLLFIVVISVALSVGLLVFLIGQAIPAQERGVRDRLAEIGGDVHESLRARRRMARRERVEGILTEIGTTFEKRYVRHSATKQNLMAAGFRSGTASAVFWGARLVLGGGMAAVWMVLGPLAGLTALQTLLLAFYFGAVGWVGPVLYVTMKRRARQKALQRALPDALDLMVVCVEAGLGLNQAMARVATEIAHISPEMGEELALVNLEIRAGVPRPEALSNLADRTQLADVRALVTMLIQTDKFGTSIAKSLRIHAETLREKRRQRAEEAAAKTTIKLVFPLVLCIFPAMFVVILGGGIIRIIETLSAI